MKNSFSEMFTKHKWRKIINLWILVRTIKDHNALELKTSPSNTKSKIAFLFVASLFSFWGTTTHLKQQYLITQATSMKILTECSLCVHVIYLLILRSRMEDKFSFFSSVLYDERWDDEVDCMSSYLQWKPPKKITRNIMLGNRRKVSKYFSWFLVIMTLSLITIDIHVYILKYLLI